MRSILMCAVLAPISALAADPPRCALPPSGLILAADVAGAPPAAPAPQQASLSVPARLPDALAALPFVRRIASAGATITDLGTHHGLRTIAARNGDQFMIFQLTDDGGTAVSGAITEIAPAQLRAVAAGNVTELPAEHGLRGLFVRSGPQFQVFYVTPDGQALIPGVLWDADGHDLTRRQVADVPGAVPTVVVSDRATPTTAAPSGQPALALVQKAHAGSVGQASAPHLWMLIDPQCIYSVRAMQMLQPYVASGRLQVSVIPLSVVDYEDKGQSTRSALALLSKPADQLVSAWQAGSVNDPPAPEATARLQANMAVAQAIGVKGTPTFVWRKTDGSEGRLDGTPSSVEALVASIGS